MKKLWLFIPTFLYISLSFSQIVFECGGALEYPNTEQFSANCSRQSSTFINRYDKVSTYIPSNNEETKIIKLNFIIFQDDFGNGNFIDDPNDNDWGLPPLNDIVFWINDVYENHRVPSDSIPNGITTTLPKMYIQFEVEYYFYQSSTFVNDISNNSGMLQYLADNDPDRLKNLNVFFTEPSGTNCDWAYASMPNFNFNNHLFVHMHCVASKAQNGGLFAAALTLAHELGHTLDLCHTYYGGGCTNPAVDQTQNVTWFDDVFGTPFPGNAPHPIPIWYYDPYLDPYDGYTNNLMGGVRAYHASPKQIGRMHSSLALRTTRKYLKDCVYNTNSLVINSNEFWDFDILLDRDIDITNNSLVEFTCKTYMPSGSSIIVNSGSTLIVDDALISNWCDDAWEGTIEVKPNAVLHLKPGSDVRLKGNGKILIHNGGKLIYEENAQILLSDDVTHLEINGDLEIGANAVFTFTGDGFMRFNITPNPGVWTNITATPTSSIILNGSGKTDKVLEVMDGSW
ncbi:MAG: hypothetical protein H0U27_08535, partial [Nitrosopumilus sp.]|nr:hypothetical protein [Nitrosopumilus sp.]